MALSPFKMITRGRDKHSETKEELSKVSKELKLARGEEKESKEREVIKDKLIADLKEEIKILKEKYADLESKISHGRETVGPNEQNSTNRATNEYLAQTVENEVIQSIIKTNADLQDEIKATKTALEEVVELVKENKQKQQQITTTYSNITKGLVRENDFANHLANHARNVGEIANIDREIIIFGVTEEEEKNFTERIKKEREMATDILKALDSEWDGQGLTDHRRIGKYTPGTKPRPLKITLRNNQLATKFLQQTKGLKDHAQFKDIGIRKCLSKPDRETLKASVQEMKHLNNQRSEEDAERFFWSIRNLKVKQIWIHSPQTRTEENRQTPST